MSGTAIRVENLSKKFLIGHQVEGDLRGSFSRRLGKLMGGSAAGSREEFWALKNISFDIKQGEAVGIIGRNGAGKSTLLKILSRITYPTTGRFEINGRVSSLLEVGTGFHPELTGRENIYLNGTILGMRRSEIRKKFDAIVDFSGVEKFIDTPVKHYSSGMKVRLAFSVAAHLEPEILIIDEVLAVGDAEFQKKCLGKMDEVSKGEGRTVLFVSHNMGAVAQLCSSTYLMRNGRMEVTGRSEEVIADYLKRSEGSTQGYMMSKDKENKNVYLAECYASNEEGVTTSNFLSTEEVCMNIVTRNSMRNLNASVGLALRDKWGNKLFTSVKSFKHYPEDGFHQVRIPANLLLAGAFSVDVAIFVPNGTVYDYASNCFTFIVSDYESEMSVYTADVGVFNIKCVWT